MLFDNLPRIRAGSLALCLLAGAASAWPQSATAPAADGQALHVVSDDNYPPYLFRDADGQVQGYLVDLWRLWERKTGRPVKLTATNWAHAQHMLLDGEADVIDLIYQTPEREPFYRFSQPYVDMPVALYAHQSVTGIQSVASLAGFRVGAQEGDACVEHLRSKGITDVVLYSNYQHIINAAVGQQIKLFCMDQYPGDYYLYRSQLHKDYPKAFELYVGQFRRAVRRDNAPTLNVVEAGMAQITPAEWTELEAKWLRRPFDWREALRQSSLLLLGALAVGGVLLIWVMSLRRAVRQRTAELTRERTRLNAVIRAIPDLVWLKDPQGVYLGCNSAFEGLYGVPEAQIVGKTDRDFVDEDSARSFRLHDQKAMAGEGPSVNEEWLTFAGDGRRRLFETVKTAMRDGRGELIGVLGVARDITERKLAAEELSRLRHQLEDVVRERTAQLERTTESLRLLAAEQAAVFEAAPVGIAVVRDRQVAQCNARLEAIFACQPGQMSGMATRAWYVDEQSYVEAAHVYGTMLRGERATNSLLLRRLNGEVFWARVNAQIIDPAQPSKGSLFVIEDATPEHEAAEALRLAQSQAEMATRLKSAFLANISHEVRTPLNAILGMSHLALEEADAAERREYLRHVQSAGQQLLRLFNDLLELSRFEAGQMELTASVFDLRGALDALLGVHAGRAAERGLALRLEIDPDVPKRLQGDARRLSQLLLVYLDNAIKFTERGEVVLRVDLHQRLAARVRLRFEVRDSGSGIAPAQQRDLFRLFEQGDASLARPHGGLGMGLAMAAQIANLMEGEVGVDSTPGQGSRFWFQAWFALPDQANQMHQRLLRVPGRRALVASAEPGVRDHLVPLLKGFGLAVEDARSGPDALRHVHRATQIGQPFDVAFLHESLPEVDAWQTARMLQALELPQPLRLLVVSDGVAPPPAGAGTLAQVMDRHATPSTVWDLLAASLASDEAASVPSSPAADSGTTGIDTAAGLRLCEGKADVYRHLLQQFAQVQAQTLLHLHSNQLEEVRRAVHLLKGQAEAMGARRLQALSAGLEQHLALPETEKTADWAELPALADLIKEVEQLGQHLPQVLAALHDPAPAHTDGPAQGAGCSVPNADSDVIRPEAEQSDSEPADNAADLEQVLSALEHRLAEGDVEALSLVSQHRAQLQSSLGVHMEPLQQALARYDFDTALGRLREARKTRP